MLSDEVVFSIEGEGYRWRDVIIAAVRWGDWAIAESLTRQGFAATRHAEVEGQTLPAGDLDAAAREFRYARDLVTALSMEQWLSQRGMTTRDWTGYLRRLLNRARWDRDIEILVARYPLADDDAAQLTLTDAVFSGEIDRWTKALAARAAAAHSLRQPGSSGAALEPPAAVHALIGDAAAVRESSRRMQRIDEAFERFRASQISEAVLRDYVSTRQLDWVRFDCRLISFQGADAASEAALLLREDGERFTGVYSVAHAIPQVKRFYFDNLQESLRDQFLAAREGDLVGPALIDNEYVLYEIQEKVLPSVRDPEVRRRAEEGVLQHALSQQLDRRVRWHVGAQ